MDYSIIDTYFIEFGKVAVIIPTDKLPGSYASLKTNLIRTDGKCIQLAYMRPNLATTTCTITIKQLPIDVSLQNSDDHITVTVTDIQLDKGNMWQTLTAKLQPGLSKVLIQVQRSDSGISGAVLDNLRISSCSQFCKS